MKLMFAPYRLHHCGCVHAGHSLRWSDCPVVAPDHQDEDKGRYHKRMHVFFRALPELAKPPLPLPPIRATLSSFFRTSKRRFARMTEKNTIDYNNGF